MARNHGGGERRIAGDQIQRVGVENHRHIVRKREDEHIAGACVGPKTRADDQCVRLIRKDAFRGAQHEFRLHPVDRGRGVRCKTDPHLAGAKV